MHDTNRGAVDVFGWVGAVIDDKYEIERVVGEGGFGVVYRARHRGFGEAVAVKCLKLDALPEAKRALFLEAFRAEGSIMFRLSQECASITRALDVGAATSPNGAWTPYLVLEWLPGRTLAEDLAERRARGAAGRPLREAFELLEPAARALEVAHRQGVAHRDVKPANLFLVEGADRRTLKILDFGVAKVMHDATSGPGGAGTAPGARAFSAAYAAPEQLSPNLGATGPWTDVFALTLVLVEVATGRRAIASDALDEALATLTSPEARPTLRQLGYDCSDAVERVLQRALAVDPRNRQAHVGELWRELEEALGRASDPNVMALARTPAASAPAITAAPTQARGATELAAPLPIALTPVHVPPGPQHPRRSGGAGGWIAAAVLGVGACALGLVLWSRSGSEAGATSATTTAQSANVTAASSMPGPRGAPATVEPSDAVNDGRDPRRPILAPEDAPFVGRRSAWDWSSACYVHENAGEWGYAAAACDEAEKTAVDTKTYPMLRYNQGRVARQAGDIAKARRLFEESLIARESREVRQALEALPR